MLTSFLLYELIGALRTLFQRYHPDAFAMQNPHRVLKFGCVLKPEGLEGGFKTENLNIFHSCGITHCGHKGIYNY